MSEHNSGKVLSTKSRLPLKLIYSENYDNKYDAFNAERLYKTAKGKRILKDKINSGIVPRP
jgi:putative endonuclease